MPEPNDNKLFVVNCVNDQCARRGYLAMADINDCGRESNRNPKNSQYCPACGEQTRFECSECSRWHLVPALLENNPYACPRAVQDALDLYNKKLVSSELVLLLLAGMYIPFWVLLFVFLNAIDLLTIISGTEDGVLTFVFWVSIVPLVLILGGGSIIGFLWRRSTNKKRKVEFVTQFPKKWALVEKYPNGIPWDWL